MTESGEIVYAITNLSTKKTNTTAKIVASTASISLHREKVIDYYIMHTVLLAITLLLIITIICCHYLLAKQKGIR